VSRTDLPPAVTAYLDSATRLLPPGTRATTRRELHANLHQAMLDGLTAGQDEAAAWAAAAAGTPAGGRTGRRRLRAVDPRHADRCPDHCPGAGGPAVNTCLLRLWREWGSPVVFALLLTQFGATAVQVDGMSMLPGLRDREWLAVPKVEGWAHRAGLGAYARGDVVVFKPPRAAGYEWTRVYRGMTLPWRYRPYLVKRVVALPGDRVRMNRGDLYVNGRAVDQGWTLPYWQGACLDRGSEVANSVAASPGRMGQAEVTVPAGHVFVLGDNRSPGGSLDSRTFGPVAVGDIAGRALASVWPLRVPGRVSPPCDGQARPEERGTPGSETRPNPRLLTPPEGLNRLP